MDDDLAAWGLDADVVAQRSGTGAPIGRVARVDRGECDVVTSEGRLRVVSDSQRAQGEVAPVTGDWVELGEEEGVGAVIQRVFDRRTWVSRRDPAERDAEQVLASNIDVVAAVHGLDRPLPPGRVERLLVLAEDSGAASVVVLTKADEAEPDDNTEAVVRAVAEDVPVIITSIEDGRGIDSLRALLGPGRTLALVGASGTGKSSLVNALAGTELLSTGEVRSTDARGRHTTTARELVLLPGDVGLVLDTPGIRSIGLWEAEEALARVFGDLEELAAECRFNDCVHRTEPGCAITAAVAAGDVDAYRVERFLVLAEELSSQRTREEDRRRRDRDIGRRRRQGQKHDRDTRRKGR